jgi:hypothetical protein
MRATQSVYGSSVLGSGSGSHLGLGVQLLLGGSLTEMLPPVLPGWGLPPEFVLLCLSSKLLQLSISTNVNVGNRRIGPT